MSPRNRLSAVCRPLRGARSSLQPLPARPRPRLRGVAAGGRRVPGSVLLPHGAHEAGRGRCSLAAVRPVPCGCLWAGQARRPRQRRRLRVRRLRPFPPGAAPGEGLPHHPAPLLLLALRLLRGAVGSRALFPLNGSLSVQFQVPSKAEENVQKVSPLPWDLPPASVLPQGDVGPVPSADTRVPRASRDTAAPCGTDGPTAWNPRSAVTPALTPSHRRAFHRHRLPSPEPPPAGATQPVAFSERPRRPATRM